MLLRLVTILSAFSIINSAYALETYGYRPTVFPEEQIEHYNYLIHPYFSFYTLSMGFQYVTQSNYPNQLSLTLSRVRDRAFSLFVEFKGGMPLWAITGKYSPGGPSPQYSFVGGKFERLVDADTLIKTSVAPINLDLGLTYGIRNRVHLYAGGGVVYKLPLLKYREYIAPDLPEDYKGKYYWTTDKEEAQFGVNVLFGIGVRLNSLIINIGANTLPKSYMIELGYCIPGRT